MPSNSFNIITYNANGISSDYLLFTNLLQRYDIDIALVCETRLPQQFNWRIPGYRIYHTPGPTQGFGGTAIVIKSILSHIEVTPPKFKNLQATTITTTINKEEFLIAAIYQPASKKLLSEDLDALTSLKPLFLVGGDWNSKHNQWKSRIITPNGRILQRHSDKFHYVVTGPDSPTHFPTNSYHAPDIIDFFIHSPKLIVKEIQTLDELNSDHIPVLLQLDFTLEKEIIRARIRHVIRWDYFRKYLSDIHIPRPNITTTGELDFHVECLTETLQSAKFQALQPNKHSMNSTSPDIDALILQKKQLRRRWQLYRDPADKTKLNQVTRTIQKQLLYMRATKFEDDLDKLTRESNIPWKISRRLTKPKEYTNFPISSSTGLLYSDDEKAGVIADELENVFKPHQSYHHYKVYHRSIQRLVNEFKNTQHVIQIQPATVSEVRRYIKKSNSNKAPGPDGITNHMLQNLSGNIIAHLTILINIALQFLYFPQIWKETTIITFPKPGKSPRLVSNHRPISLLNTMGKIYERIILKRLSEYILSRHIIPDEQFGFMPNRSTVHQLTRITEYITRGFHYRYSTIAAFLDIEKAYDTVWHNGLIAKLILLQIPDNLISIISSFLSKRKFRVRVRKAYSPIKYISAGVPQGSVLAPTLYNLYTSDIPHHNATQLAMYADDTVIFSRKINILSAYRAVQKHLQLIDKWAKTWKIKINNMKSNAIIFTKCRPVPPPQLMLHKFRIAYVQKTKYLGILLHPRLNWKDHILRNKYTALNRLKQLIPLLLSVNLSLKCKMTLYKVYIRSQMTYAAPAWGFAPRTTMHHLQVVQNKALRIIGGYDFYTTQVQMHDDLEISTIPEYIKILSKTFYHTAKENENKYISNLGNYNAAMYHKHRTPKHILM